MALSWSWFPNGRKVGGEARVAACVLAMLAACAATVSAQPPVHLSAGSDTDTSTFGEEVSVNHVIVPVVVQRASEYVRGLGAADFELRVEGILTPLQSFDEELEGPISVTILQDLSGSMEIGGKLDTSRKLIDCLLDHSRPGDRYSIATFASGHVEVEVPYSEQLDLIRSRMDRWRAFGTTALHDALLWLPDLTAESNDPRRVALLITDGVDNASDTSSDESSTLLRRAAVPVYAVGIDSGAPDRQTTTGNSLFPDADLLNSLAQNSGGRYHSLWQPDQAQTICKQIAADLRHQYVLGFTTADYGRSAYREIEVRVRKREGSTVEAFYRKGYRGRLPDSPNTTELGSL